MHACFRGVYTSMFSHAPVTVDGERKSRVVGRTKSARAPGMLGALSFIFVSSFLTIPFVVMFLSSFFIVCSVHFGRAS